MEKPAAEFEDAEIALWKGPFGKELGSPANRHGSESSWKWILCPSLPFRWLWPQPRPGLQPYERIWAGPLVKHTVISWTTEVV